jgi:hypothetical protein
MTLRSLRSVSTVLVIAAAALSACSDSTGSRAGPAARMDVVGGSAQTGTVGAELPQPVVVKVTDAKGRAVKGQVVNFVVTAGGGTVFAGTALTDDDGMAQERWTLGKTAGSPQTLEARAVDSSTGQALVFATFTATANPGAPASFQAFGDTDVAGVPGSPVEDPFAVEVRDTYGNPVPGAQVTWAVTSGGGTITSATTTDADGRARTQWVLGTGAAATQSAQATLGTASIAFRAYTATTLTRLAGDGQSGGPGMLVTVRVRATGPSGAIGNLPLTWQVTGGGTLTFASTQTNAIPEIGDGFANWTLGGPGPQTLTVSSGSLSTTFTALVAGTGTRTLVAQLPGRVLDADAGRVLWLDSTATAVAMKIRDRGTGSDVTVSPADTSGRPLAGALFTGGALVVHRLAVGGGAQYTLWEWRAGTRTWLGPIDYNPYPVMRPQVPSVSGNWAAWGYAGTVYRRDLAAGTTVVVDDQSASNPGAGPNGDVVYSRSDGVWRYRNGTTTLVTSQRAGARTDGVNVVYVTENASGMVVVLVPPGGGSVGLGVSSRGTHPTVELAGGWAGYSSPGVTFRTFRRSPAGVVEPVQPVGFVEAIGPDGMMVYSSSPGGARYVAPPGMPGAAVGEAAASDRVVYRGGKFLLLSGGNVYELSAT